MVSFCLRFQDVGEELTFPPRLRTLSTRCLSNDEITQFQTAGLALDQRFDCCIFMDHISLQSRAMDWISYQMDHLQEEMWECSFDYIADYCRKSDDNHNANNRGRTFDGIFGFSQGAAIKITNFCHPVYGRLSII